MTQIIAYKQLTMRQEVQEQIFIAIAAPAGYGKSQFLKAFVKSEHLHRRRWQALAPSRVAAANVNGLTIHALFQLNTDGQTRMEDNSKEAITFANITGLVIDEYTMFDDNVWCTLRHMPMLSIASTSAKRTYFPIVWTSGCNAHWRPLPITTSISKTCISSNIRFPTEIQVYILLEHRQQQKDNDDAHILNRIRKRGLKDDHEWPTVGVTKINTIRDIVDEDVREYFIDAYVRERSIHGSNTDLEDGVAMTSLRRNKNRWNEVMMQQIEDK